MKFFLCLVALAVVAINAEDELPEVQDAEESQAKLVVLPTVKVSQPKPILVSLKPQPLPTYKPKVITTIRPKNIIVRTTLPTYRPKVIPTSPPKKIGLTSAGQDGAYVAWTSKPKSF